MNEDKYQALVSRLEQDAEKNPQRYLASVVIVASLGLLIIGIAIGFSVLAAALLVGIVLLAVFSGGKALILLGKLGKLIFIMALPAWTMVKSSFRMLFSRLPSPEGRVLARQEAPALFKVLDELRHHMNGPPVHKVLLTDELNAAIVQHPRFGLFGWEQNFLILGLPLLHALQEKEALAVIAHEYGHLSGHHSRLGGFIYRFRAAWGRAQELADQWDDWGSRQIARLFRWYAPYFNAYTFVLARQNEYLADRSSVELAGPGNAATALMRIEVVSRFNDEVFWPTLYRRAALEPEPVSSRTAFWMQSVRTQLSEAARVQFLEAARQERTSNFDTHPSLSDRLAAMGTVLDSATPLLLEPPAISAASTWLGDSLPAIQAEFDATWRDGVAERWRARHSYLQERQQRLAQLATIPVLDPNEQWEYFCIAEEVQPEVDLLPRLDSLLDQAPGLLEARFRRGMMRLERGMESGIDDLEAVMAKDADAILAGCEAAWHFYRTADPQKAEQYRERWGQRSEHLRLIQAERDHLPPDAVLEPADLDDETVEAVRRILRRQGKKIRKVYLLSRALKTDQTIKDYVLAFETALLTLGNNGPSLVNRLAQEEFPVPMFIVHLGSSPYKRFRKSIKRLNIEPLAW